MSRKKITRRQFIKTTGTVAAGMALAGTAGLMTPRPAWAKKNNVIIGMTRSR
jgi:hypothetical protein